MKGEGNIISYGYDSPSQTLEIEFQDSCIYQYYNVSQNIFDALSKEHFKEEFFTYQIKNLYPYSRVG